jgi:hypothetical protein
MRVAVFEKSVRVPTTNISKAEARILRRTGSAMKSAHCDLSLELNNHYFTFPGLAISLPMAQHEFGCVSFSANFAKRDFMAFPRDHEFTVVLGATWHF